MPTTNFKVFNEANTEARTFNDSEYEEATQRLNGVTPGMAISRLHNKLYLQSTAMAKAMADAIVANGDDCMDDDIPGISASINKLIDDRAKAVSDTIPTGVLIPFGGSVAPDGYLFADGSAVSRTDYADLFAVYGTTFGAGDGSTTFNLPDYTGGTFIEGDTTAGTYKSAGLPNITGGFTTNCHLSAAYPLLTNQQGCCTAFETAPKAYGTFINLSTFPDGVSIDASRSSAIYGASDTVQPKSLTCRVIVKY